MHLNRSCKRSTRFYRDSTQVLTPTLGIRWSALFCFLPSFASPFVAFCSCFGGGRVVAGFALWVACCFGVDLLRGRWVGLLLFWLPAFAFDFDVGGSRCYDSLRTTIDDAAAIDRRSTSIFKLFFNNDIFIILHILCTS